MDISWLPRLNWPVGTGKGIFPRQRDGRVYVLMIKGISIQFCSLLGYRMVIAHLQLKGSPVVGLR